LIVRGRYWNERSTAGAGDEVWLDKTAVIDDKSSSREKDEKKSYDFRQTFATTSQKGKYSFEIENPWSFETGVTIRIYSSETSFITLEQNSQHYGMLSDGKSERYEIFMGNAGKWYLWVYSCTGIVDLKIEDSNSGPTDNTGVVVIPEGKDYLYQATVINEGMSNRVKYVTVTKSSEVKQGDTGIFISSSLVNEQDFVNYDLKGGDLVATPRFVYGERSSKVVVEVKKAEFYSAEATDRINYHVRLCPYDWKNPEDKQDYCKLRQECRHYREEYFINSQKSQEALTASFEEVHDGLYYVQTVAIIEHHQQMVKFIPYKVEMVTVEQPLGHKVSSNWWKIFVGFALVVLVVAVCMKGFKKLQAFSEDRGFELQMFGKKKGYEMLGET